MKNKKKHNNITKNEKKLKHKINIFNAIIGKNIDLNKLDNFDKNLKLNYKFKHPGELGCYLSHYLLIKKAAKSNKKYTVIFEDDFKILSKDLNNEILKITSKVNDFDIIHLGNLYESKSEKIVDNIYHKSNLIQLLGTHALLINNKNANKILNKLNSINQPIDNQYENLINKNEITNYVIYPSLVIQNNNFKSELRSDFYIKRREFIQKLLKLVGL